MPLFYDTRTFICSRVSSWHGILSSKPFFCVLTCNVIARKDPISIKKSIGALAPSLVTWNPEFCHRSEPSYVIFLYLGNRAYEHYPLYTIEFDKSNPKVSRGGGWVNYHSYQLSLFLCLPFVVEGLPTTQRKRKQESWSFLRWILRERVTLERRKMKHDNCS